MTYPANEALLNRMIKAAIADPEGAWRLVRVYEGALENFEVFTADGRRITPEWSEVPDALGIWTLWFKVEES